MKRLRKSDSEIAGKSEIYRLSRRIEKAKSGQRLRAGLADFSAYLTWLEKCRHKTEHALLDASGEEVAFAALDDFAAQATTGETMTALEIEKAIRDAGFELTESADPVRLVFTRGPHTLIVNADATWVCGDKGGRRAAHGYSFGSLLEFLAEFPRT